METKKFIVLEDLEVYKLSRRLSLLAWKIYKALSIQGKKAGGDQFIDSTDSVGANIAEGYSRFYYLDRIKFYYNARGSLTESSAQWLELLFEREFVIKEDYEEFKSIA